MAEVINMPRLSDTMEEGTVASWLKKVGDKIEEGDILAEIETDKATMEFESFNEGVLLHIGIQEGETAKVDTLLAIIGEEGEDISGLLSGSTTEAKAETPTEDSKESENETPKTEEALPEGVIVVTMPRLSDTMEEGTVATWLKQIGDSVEEGDILAEIETDKATMEFESFQSGTLLFIGLEEGASAKVDSLLAIIGPAGTDVSSIAKNFAVEGSSVKKEEAPKQEALKQETPKAEAKKEAPKQQAKAVVSNTDSGRVFISPLAKKMAEEKGIQLNQVKGSGENGRIVKRDIENFTPSSSGSASTAKFVATGQEDFDEIPNSNMRKAIAKNLAKSKFTAPHYYLNVEFDMENAIAFRKQYNSVPDIKISYNDMIVKHVL